MEELSLRPSWLNGGTAAGRYGYAGVAPTWGSQGRGGAAQHVPASAIRQPPAPPATYVKVPVGIVVRVTAPASGSSKASSSSSASRGSVSMLGAAPRSHPMPPPLSAPVGATLAPKKEEESEESKRRKRDKLLERRLFLEQLSQGTSEDSNATAKDAGNPEASDAPSTPDATATEDSSVSEEQSKNEWNAKFLKLYGSFSGQPGIADISQMDDAPMDDDAAALDDGDGQSLLTEEEVAWFKATYGMQRDKRPALVILSPSRQPNPLSPLLSSDSDSD